MKTKRTRTNVELAAKYSVSPKTISNWKRDGAPLHDEKRLAVWLSSRRNLPPGLKVPTSAPPRAAAEPSGERIEALGAAAALARLQAEEVSAYSRLQLAINGADALAIRLSRQNWLAILESLRRYESAVSADARQRNLLVPKGEVEKHVARLAYGCRIVSEGMLPELAATIQGEPDPIRARQIARRCLWHAITAGGGHAILQQVPRWLLGAFSADFRAYLGGDQIAEMERFADALKSAGEAIPAIANEQTPVAS